MKEKGSFYFLAAVILAGVIAAYSNHFQNGFHFDDSHTVVQNVYIKDIRNVPLFFLDGTTFSSLPTNQTYRPLVSLTLALDYWLGEGLKPFYFHLSTFILFLLQGILMYLLFLKVFNFSHKNSWNPFTALFAAGWYLLHPANAETINYVIARSDSISTLFVVLALVLFIYSPRMRRFHIYLIPVGLGLLTKPVAAMFAPLLLAYILLFEIEGTGTGKKAPLPLYARLKMAVPSFVFSGIFLIFIEKMNPKTWVPGGISHLNYAVTQPFVILHYFLSFFLPLDLSADSDWRALDSMMDIRFFAGSLFIIALTAIALAARKGKYRPISFGLLWFLIALLPTSAFFPLAEVLNDHRMFFPFVGLAMSICWSTGLLLERLAGSVKSEKALKAAAFSAALIILSAYACGTHERNKVWATDLTLWRDVAEKSPENGRGLMNYGLALMAKADYKNAEIQFTRALELTPGYPYLHINLGILKNATGDPEEAEIYFKNGIAYGPIYPECYFHYAKFLKHRERPEEAIRNLARALELLPAHMGARHLLMDIYYEGSRMEELVLLARETLRMDPADLKALFYLSLAGGANSKPPQNNLALAKSRMAK